MAEQLTFNATAVGLVPVDLDRANAALAEWGHYLGPVTRPFGSQAWQLEVDGQPVSVAVSASTVSATAAGMVRGQLVELARLCSRPGYRWATRPMLRLWREVAAPRWPYWPVVAAVAYSQNARHGGQIYRFDGWTRATDAAGSTGGGGTWSRTRHDGDIERGLKSLWVWHYEPVGTPNKGGDR